MNKFVFPAVFYFDKVSSTYCAAIDDLAIYAVGDTVEEAFEHATSMLESYIKTSLKYDIEIPAPSSFDELVEKHAKQIVMLVEYSN